MFRWSRFVLSAILLTFAAASAFAEDDGREDLDKATDTKLNATTISDLSEVVRLTRSAIQKGLNDEDATFAKQLLASTLLQRAQETVKQILGGGVASPDDFRRKREFAISDLQEAIVLDPKQSESHLLLAQLQLLPGGDLKKSREAIDRALELGFQDPASHAKALVLRAGLQEEPEKKLADLDEAVRLMPGEVATIRARGLLLADLDKLDLALADLDKAIELDPKDGPTYEAKALVLARQKRFDEALAALEKARELNPESVMPLVQRARVHTHQEKLDAALEDLNQAIAVDPTNVAVLLMRGSLHQDRGEKEAAMADVDRALELKPDLPLALRTRALLLANNERFDEALAELEKLRKIEPKDPTTLLQLAMLYSATKKIDRAIETYTQLLAETPDDWRALRGRGDAYLNIGKHAEAIADYEKALKLQPEDHGILNNLAWVLCTSPDDALRDGKRAIELATQACEVTEYKMAHILSTLAAAYAETGDFDNAVQWSTKAVELDDKEHAEALKKELESYKAKKPWRESLNEAAPADAPPKTPEATQP